MNKKLSIYIEYNPLRGYYFGILQHETIVWNSKYYERLYKIKYKIYELYPDAIIHVKE